MNAALELTSPLGWRLVAVFLAAASVWMLFHELNQSAGRFRRRALAWLRFSTGLLLSFTLLKPEYITTTTQSSKPHVSILLDDTESTQTRDIRSAHGPANEPMKRIDWIQAQIERHFWAGLDERYSVSVEPFSKTTDAPARSAATAAAMPAGVAP